MIARPNALRLLLFVVPSERDPGHSLQTTSTMGATDMLLALVRLTEKADAMNNDASQPSELWFIINQI